MDSPRWMVSIQHHCFVRFWSPLHPNPFPPLNPNTSTGKETSVNPLALLRCFTAVITTDTKRRMFSSPKFLRYFSKQTQVDGTWLHEKYPTRVRGVRKDEEESWSADNWAQLGFRFIFSDHSTHLSKSKLLIFTSKQYFSGSLNSLTFRYIRWKILQARGLKEWWFYIYAVLLHYSLPLAYRQGSLMLTPRNPKMHQTQQSSFSLIVSHQQSRSWLLLPIFQAVHHSLTQNAQVGIE